jgi:ketosteroid isomerase-like protein
VRDFFAAIERGDLPDHLLTPDMSVWTVSSGAADKTRFQSAVKLLASIFDGTLVYTIDAVTAEEDRVAAEIRSHGTLIGGELCQNTHLFVSYPRRAHRLDGRVHEPDRRTRRSRRVLAAMNKDAQPGGQ